MFSSLLIANRGEIACRVIRTARQMGLHTIAVYSEADRQARHAHLADEAVLIGPAPARDSYLAIDKIVAAARQTGAEAIHPGYGFLSENADFAEACAAARLVFVGPPPSAIRAMGSKSEAKAIMAKAGVPLVPGYHGARQDTRHLAAEAGRIGYPVLIKASAGGGGKGMRRVDRPEEFQDALDAAKREAGSAFGDDRMLIEKYLVRPRHIEIQIFADSAGNVVHLFERDCSVQRRHQKVLEEAPAPGLSPERREAMAAAAVAAAEAIGYVGAGTVEFIVAEDGTFYFMEMNTRLQVEHPVTELTTGFDLVEWQLRVAAGERLPRSQAEIAALGHAIEARLYAEDPSRDFLPATGRLRRLVLPAETLSVRVDSGVAEGDEIGVHYDPMIAKIIARGYDRASALRRLGRALAETRVAGVVTNLDLLGAIVRHPAFAEGGVDTGFIERHKAELIPAATAPPDETLAMAALAVLLERRETAAVTAAAGPDPHSPWHEVGGWRLNGDAQYGLRFHSLDDGSERGVTVHFRGRGFRLDLSGGSMTAEVDRGEGGAIRAFLDGRRTVADATKSGDRLTVFLRGRSWRFSLIDPLAAAAQAEAGAGRMVAPMPGRIVAVHVKAGDRVRRGQPLVALEAMKMEHGVAAPADGIVEAVHFTLGDLVDEGAELLSLTAEEGSGS